MKAAERLYKVFNLLNLDVIFGAVISALYFSKLFAVEVNVFSLIALGLTVWLIYTADRLLDVKRAPANPTSERHKFHKKNYGTLLVALIMVAVLVGISIPFLHKQVITGGFLLGAIVGFYLLLQNYLPLKEFVVAGLYTLGVLLPSWPLQTELIAIDHLLLVGQFFTAALTNLLIFSWFEFEADQRDGHASIATRWGKTLCAKLVILLGMVSFWIAAYLLTTSEYKLAPVIFLLMTVILIGILFFHSYFSKYSRYRFLGDAVFFLSLLGLFQ